MCVCHSLMISKLLRKCIVSFSSIQYIFFLPIQCVRNWLIIDWLQALLFKWFILKLWSYSLRFCSFVIYIKKKIKIEFFLCVSTIFFEIKIIHFNTHLKMIINSQWGEKWNKSFGRKIIIFIDDDDGDWFIFDYHLIVQVKKKNILKNGQNELVESCGWCSWCSDSWM